MEQRESHTDMFRFEIDTYDSHMCRIYFEGRMQ